MKKKQISKTSHLDRIMSKIDFVVEDIKSIKIQWATNVARAAFTVLREGMLEAEFVDKKDLLSFLKKAINHLVSVRSTEPMLQNGMKYALRVYKKLEKEDISDIVAWIDDALQELLDRIYEWDQIRSEFWSVLIRDWFRVMTHCHSGSVIKIIRKAWKEDKKNFKMVNTEARPLYQWRITAQDLLDMWIPTTLITDDMWPYYIDQTLEDTPKVDMLILWCDAIKPDGSIINKVGSFSLALSAWHSWIPVYIVGSLTKYDAENKIKIELRDGSEIRPMAPEGLNILNFAFDTVPAKFITGIVSRSWILKPEDVAEIIAKNYPWMN